MSGYANLGAGASGSPLLLAFSDSHNSWFPNRSPGGMLHPLANYNMEISTDDALSILSPVLGISKADNIANLAPTFAEKLRVFIPQRHPEKSSTQSSILLDSSQKHPIWRLFEITAYFASNNIFEDQHTEYFLKWVLENNYAEHLNAFLKLDLATARSFRFSVLKAEIRAKTLEFLRNADSLALDFDKCGEVLMEIEDLDFLNFVLPRLSVESKKGQLGGRLLRAIACTSYVNVAKYLIEAEADVNVKISSNVCSGKVR